ncbi:hypothetical protein K0U07_00210 [bacterium]|nr:hypothetical protein [bacterium]
MALNRGMGQRPITLSLAGKGGFCDHTFMKCGYGFLLFLLVGCSTADERVQSRRMQNNKSTEKIYRLSHEKVYEEKEQKLVKREPYPWENAADFPKITMNMLRCRGCSSNKERTRGDKAFTDCNGMKDHGLPYVDGEEFVYPVLVSLLNKVQNSLNKKVVVTSGHRCPKHNDYLNLGKSRISKYMIGACVDFFIEGMENDAEQIVEEIISLYKEDSDNYCHFTKSKSSKGTPSWRNKEISISIQKEGEHSILYKKDHPVLSISVRYDRQKGEHVHLDWKHAYQGFIVH